MAFIVFSLPRSRSAWLSCLLADGVQVGHDIGVDCSKISDFTDAFEHLAGTCETAAMMAWRVIRYHMPEAKFVVVARRTEEVCESMAKFGLPGYETEIAVRSEHLAVIAAQDNTLVVNYDDLAEFDGCSAIYEFCHGKPLPFARWKNLSALNVQIDLPKRIAKLRQNHDALEGFKANLRVMTAELGGGKCPVLH